MPTIINGSVNAITFPDGTIQTTAATGGFDTGTVMLFYQAAAPTGWTQVTSQNNKALRVVSGTGGGTGGSVAFTTAFASGLSAGATTLSTSEMPSHTHSVPSGASSSGCYNIDCGAYGGTGFGNGQTTGGAGGGGSHTHTIPSFAVQYIDIIICSKN